MRRNRFEQMMDILKNLTKDLSFQTERGMKFYRLQVYSQINNALFCKFTTKLARLGYVVIEECRPRMIRITQKGRQILADYIELKAALEIA